MRVAFPMSSAIAVVSFLAIASTRGGTSVSAFQSAPRRASARPASDRPTSTAHRQSVAAFLSRKGVASPLTPTASTTADGVYGDDASPSAKRTIALPRITSDGTTAKTVAATAATVLTYVINNQYSLGPVLGSSVVALASAIALGPTRPVLQLAALCGSFAGMARSAVIPSPAAAFVLGVVCSYMIRLFDRRKWLIGKGGRLGFIAQCACTSTFVALRYGMRVVPSSIRTMLESVLGDVVAPAALADFSLYKSLSAVSVLSTLSPMILSTIGGAFFMQLWKICAAKLKLDRIATPTAAVGATGAIAALIGPTVAGPAFVGSFVAMSAPTVLADGKALAASSALSVFAWVAMTGVLIGGWGGKMGTAALLGVLLYGLLLEKSGDKINRE